MAADKRRMRLADILAYKTIGGLTVSADGRLAVFVVSVADEKANKGVSELWAWSAERGVWQVTFGGQAGTPRLSPKGDALGFISDRVGEKKQLFVMELGLSEGKKVTSFEEGVEDFRWSPDGRRVLVLAKADKTEEEKAKDKDKRDWWTVDADERRRRLWVVGVDGGNARATQCSADDEHVMAACWVDGKRLAYAASPLATTDSQWTQGMVKTVGAEGRGRREVARTAGILADPGMAVSADGGQLLICESASKDDIFWYVPRVMDLKTGQKQLVAPGFDRTVIGARWVGNGEVMLVAGEGAVYRLYVGKVGGRMREVETGPGPAAPAEVAVKAGEVFYVNSEPGRPEEVYRAALDGGRAPEALTRVNRGYARVQMADTEVIRWKAPDGMEIEGIVYLPARRKKGRPVPLILMPHGGPYGASVNSFAAGIWPSFLCANGYAVLMPNFRGSTGYGLRFMQKIIGNWGDGPMNDCLAGVDYLVRRGIADARKLAIVGGSYGGYLTTYTIGHTRRFRCAVAIAPVTSNVSMFGTTDIPHFMVNAAGGASPDFSHRFWRDQSPTHYASKVKTPTLVVTGDADVRVPPGQSSEYYRLLKHHGVETKLVLYPREPHGIGEPRHRLNHVREILEWVEGHMK